MNGDDFFGNGIFEWQTTYKNITDNWKTRCYDREKYWGAFEKDIPLDYAFPEWAVTGFTKYKNNPIFAPSAASWDCGHSGGGVHNGSILRHNNKFYYIYRGEMPQELVKAEEVSGDIPVVFDYVCDIGVAVSSDGVRFCRLPYAPLFRRDGDEKYSFEDVCCVKHDGMFYLFCNRWDWHDPVNPKVCGTFLATSRDLIVWQKKGLVFPEAARIHRNACVLQNPCNEAVKVNGKFVMYLNDGLMAFSDDMLNWKSEENANRWPGGEGCFALADYDKNHPESIILFTGGHHTGHFYAIGEVLFSREDVKKPLDYLKKPVLFAEDRFPFEDGCSPQGNPVSGWRDTVFFTGLTEFCGEYLLYYGGSEYYTCLARAKGKNACLK